MAASDDKLSEFRIEALECPQLAQMLLNHFNTPVKLVVLGHLVDDLIEFLELEPGQLNLGLLVGLLDNPRLDLIKAQLDLAL